MASRKIWDNLKPGNEYAARRNLHGSPPADPDTFWTNATTQVADAYGVPQQPDNELTDHGYRDRRLIWLAQFDLTVTTKGRYRYWYWLGDVVGKDDACHSILHEGVPRVVQWWERRKVTDPMPDEPGLWPLDR